MEGLQSYPWLLAIASALVLFVFSLVPLRKHLRSLYVDKTEIFIDNRSEQQATILQAAKEKKVVIYVDDTLSYFSFFASMICIFIAYAKALNLFAFICGTIIVIPLFFLWVISFFVTNKRKSGEAPYLKYPNALVILCGIISAALIGGFIYLQIKNGTDLKINLSFATNIISIVQLLITGILPLIISFVIGVITARQFSLFLISLFAKFYTGYSKVTGYQFIEIGDEQKKEIKSKIVYSILIAVFSLFAIIASATSKSIIGTGISTDAMQVVSSSNILDAFNGKLLETLLMTTDQPVALALLQLLLYFVLYYINFCITLFSSLCLFGLATDRTLAVFYGLAKAFKTISSLLIISFITENAIVILQSLKNETTIFFNFSFIKILAIIIFLVIVQKTKNLSEKKLEGNPSESIAASMAKIFVESDTRAKKAFIDKVGIENIGKITVQTCTQDISGKDTVAKYSIYGTFGINNDMQFHAYVDVLKINGSFDFCILDRLIILENN